MGPCEHTVKLSDIHFGRNSLTWLNGHEVGGFQIGCGHAEQDAIECCTGGCCMSVVKVEVDLDATFYLVR